MKMPSAPGAVEPQVLILKDGRKFTYYDNGIVSNRAILLHHGTPGLGELWTPMMAYLATRGIKAVAYNRAGYQDSDRVPGRTITSNTPDMKELLDHLEVEEFVSVGWSGGGPHALHATFLPGSKGADLVAGVAPYQEMGESFLIGQPETETIEVLEKIAGSFEGSLETIVKDIPEVEKVWTFENFQKNDEGRARYAEFADLYREVNAHLVPALVNGMINDPVGCADDNLAILNDWGFKVNEVKKPVSIWNGDLDKAVPSNMAKWQHAQIEGSTLHLFEDQTHGSIMVEYMQEILASAIEKLTS